ncbi:ABC transporter permease [Candidatus Bathycorpusculum sp.]|uniref:ABC transporter permease n=1 Tax=Candidatus Bathycorpusculum sp. TaxID=2994959 RepID=UPI00283916CF|nr:ABC transporter permease [Candidatus Termitimicrobium sp.]MCL2432519.1 ABC transporter permease [Candidatus Termitimicrobium sp.]
MLKGFTSIVVKELKELIRDPKILIGMIVLPLIMFPVLGMVLGYAAETAQSEALKSNLLVVDNDNSPWSSTFVSYLSSSMNVIIVNNTTPQQVVDQGLLAQHDSTMFLVIPQGFGENLTQHAAGAYDITGTVNMYAAFNGGGGIFSGFGGSSVTVLVEGFNRIVAPDLVMSSQSSIIKGQIQEGIDASLLSSLLLSQSIVLPVAVLMMLIFAMQIAATSVAMEKEEKTLETLLTVPVDRFAILMGKVSSTIIVAGVAAVTVLIGYNFMLDSMMTGLAGNLTAGLDLVALGLVPSTFGYVLLGLSLFFTLLSALALAVVMSAFSENVRGAQALVGYLYPLIFIPSMALIYLDINSLPIALRAVFYAIPYSQPIIASQAVITGDYLTVIFGIVYVALFTVAIMYVASRLFATEKILTAKLAIGKRGNKKQQNE